MRTRQNGIDLFCTLQYLDCVPATLNLHAHSLLTAAAHNIIPTFLTRCLHHFLTSRLCLGPHPSPTCVFQIDQVHQKRSYRPTEMYLNGHRFATSTTTFFLQNYHSHQHQERLY